MTRKEGPNLSPKKAGPPDRPSRGEEGKLSDRILDLALQALKRKEGPLFGPALQVALLLAVAAWNRDAGDPSTWRSHQEHIDDLGWGFTDFRSLLISQNFEDILSSLLEYKKARYPEDKRIVVNVYLGEKGTLRVEWEDPAKGTNRPLRKSKDSPPSSPDETPLPPDPGEKNRKGPIGARLHEEALKEKAARGQSGEVVDFFAYKSFLEESKKALDEIMSLEKSKRLPRGFRIYIHAFNVLMALAENLLQLKELASLNLFLQRAEKEYMPGWPPMSPVSSSFFSSWSLLDAWTGPHKETLASIFLDFSEGMAPPSEMSRLFRTLARSRMGIYVHEGAQEGSVFLRELVTDKKLQAVTPNGFTGEKGELWFVRVLPPPSPEIEHLVILNSPYILAGRGKADWNAYFDRALASGSPKRRIASYERHMKFGPNRKYWLEYILDAYNSHTDKAIYLTGIPDLPETLPHHNDNL